MLGYVHSKAGTWTAWSVPERNHIDVVQIDSFHPVLPLSMRNGECRGKLVEEISSTDDERHMHTYV